MPTVTDSEFALCEGAPGQWPRPRNQSGLPLPWTAKEADDPANVDEPRMASAHTDHLCQMCALPLAPDNCYIVALGTEADRVPAGNTVVEGAGLHGRCLRLSVPVCPPLQAAFSGHGPMYAYLFAVHPADIAASYNARVRNALWVTVTEQAAEHGRVPQATALRAVNVVNPALAAAFN